VNESANVAPKTSSPLIRLERVSKSYRRGDETVQVLDHVDLTVPRGAFLALMAPSGSGKSTLLNLLGGLDRPDEGSIVFDGVPLESMGPRELTRWRATHVGFVFQLYHLLPVLSAARNVELPLLLQRLGRAERQKRVAAALSLVGFPEDRYGFRPTELSGGQQQRVAIARAIVTNPTVLLCDEPTGDLDRKAGDEILDLLAELNRRLEKTVVMVTHDPHAAERAHTLVRLDKGLVGEIRTSPAA
jgi:putative ABC transport system ATP-binding protein